VSIRLGGFSRARFGEFLYSPTARVAPTFIIGALFLSTVPESQDQTFQEQSQDRKQWLLLPWSTRGIEPRMEPAQETCRNPRCGIDSTNLKKLASIN